MLVFLWRAIRYVFLTALLFAAALVAASPILLKAAESRIGSLLQSYISAAGPYRLTLSDLHLSPLRLMLSAKDIRIEEEGAAFLYIESAHVTVSLEHIFDRILILKEVLLRGGFALGVTPEKGLGRLVERLGAEDKGDGGGQEGLELRLQRLSVQDASISQPLGERLLFFEEAAGELDAKNDEYSVRVKAGSLTLVPLPPYEGESRALGKVSAVFSIDSRGVSIAESEVALMNSWIRAAGRMEEERISAKIEHHLDMASLGLDSRFEGVVRGGAEVGGAFTSINGSGRAAAAPFIIKSAGGPSIQLDGLQCGYRFVFGPQESSLTLEELSAGSGDAKASLVRPIQITPHSVSGAIIIRASELKLGTTELAGVEVNIAAEGRPDEPRVSAQASIASLRHENLILPALDLSVAYASGSLSYRVAHDKDDWGAFESRGEIDLPGNRPPYVRRASFDVRRFKQPLGDRNLLLSARGEVSGPGTVKGLSGRASVEVELPGAPETLEAYSGQATLGDGKVELHLSDRTNKLRSGALLSLQERKAEIRVAVQDLNLGRAFSTLQCGRLSLTAQYGFDLPRPSAGNGEISIRTAEAGCGRSALFLATPAVVRVEGGVLALDSLQIAGRRGAEGRLSGTVSQTHLDVHAELKGDLRPFSAFVPVLDEIGGQLKLNLFIRGGLNDLRTEGIAELSDGEFMLGEPGILGESIGGRARFSGSSVVTLENLSGVLNGGNFLASGDLNLSDISASRLRLKFDGVELQPVQNSDMLLSGEVEAAYISSVPVISGELRIDEATYEKNIDLRTIVNILTDLLRRRPPAKAVPSPRAEIRLDLAIKAPAQLMFITNWAETEIGGELTVRGTVNKPEVEGALRVLGGWFQISRSRFEMVSGRIVLDPLSNVPRIELRAEASAVGQSLQSIHITADISGPITGPEVTFSSDTGLSQQEIIRLLTAGQGGGGTQALLGQISKQAGLGELNILREDSILGFEKPLRLPKINRLSVEPQLDPETGTILPEVIAEMKMGRDLTLGTESVIGGASPRSRFKASYLLDPELSLKGAYNAPSAAEEGSVSGDVILEVNPERPPLQIKLYGVREVSEDELLQALHLSTSSRLTEDRLDRIAQRAKRFYQSQGFFSAEVSAECDQSRARLCRRLELHAEEGPRSRVTAIVFAIVRDAGRPPAEMDRIPIRPQPAAEEALEETVSTVRSALRDKGYIGARVKGEYVEGQAAHERELVLVIDPRRKVTIAISGNRAFDRTELLNTVDFYRRKFPFTASVATRLRDRITDLYHSRGYPDARVTFQRVREGTRAVRLSFAITEGRQIKVSKISFRGNVFLRERELREALSPEQRQRVYQPRFLVESELEGNVSILRDVYRRNGFPAAEIAYRVNRTGNKAEIIYLVSEGRPERASELSVHGMPEEVHPPETPKRPFSRAALNEYMEALEAALREGGYPNARLRVEEHGRFDEVEVGVSPGSRTQIGKIRFEGLNKVGEQTVRRFLGLRSGAAWTAASLNEARRRLSRSGLFRSVELGPLDENLDGQREDLLVKLEERDLTALTLGGGYDTAYGVHFASTGINRNLFKDGRSVSFGADLYYDASESLFSQGAASLRYSDPFFLYSSYEFSQDLTYQRLIRTTQEYDLSRLALSSTLSRNHEDRGLIYLAGHTISDEELTDVPADVILSPLDTGAVRLSYVTGSLTYDRRDSALDARRGYVLSLSPKLASEGLGSDADFFSATLRASHVQPLPLLDGKIALANSTRAASAWPFGATQHIPITQRFYLGGQTTVRGFRENSLGPRGNQGGIIGGDQLFSNSFEVRCYLYDVWSIHTFLDAGNVFLRGRGDYHLRSGAGIGSRFHSPVGAIGADVGFPLDERDGEPSVRFHLSIATDF